MLIPMRRFENGESFYTDWIPAAAGNVIFRALPIDYDSSPTLTINFYTKNSNETGEGTVVVDSGAAAYKVELTSADTMGVVDQELFKSTASAGEGLKEWVRLKVTVTGTGWMLAKVFNPIFFESATPA